MTIGPLLDQLRDSARADTGKVLADARDAARRLVEAAAARLEHRREAALVQRAAEWSRERERQLDAAREAAARDVLAASERLVTRALDGARQRAGNPAWKDPHLAWLATTVPAAAGYLPDGPVTVHVGGEAPGPLLPGRPVRVERLGAPLGAILESGDGRARVDATLERFLRAERPRLAQAIVTQAIGGSS